MDIRVTRYGNCSQTRAGLIAKEAAIFCDSATRPKLNRPEVHEKEENRWPGIFPASFPMGAVNGIR